MLETLNITMAYLNDLEFPGACFFDQGHAPRKPDFVVLDFSVPIHQAYMVRSAVANCRGVGVLRCIPKPCGRQACLELHFSRNQIKEVMHCLIECVPNGQFGCVRTWKENLALHHLTCGDTETSTGLG